MEKVDKNSKRRRILRENLIAYLFQAPSLLGMICFNFFPLVMALYVSLTDWNYMKGIGNWNFVGLQNFIDLFEDSWFIVSLKNTILFSIVTVPIGLLLSLVIAVLIDEYIHQKVAGVIRIMMYMPHICNVVAISTVWMALYSKYGPFTQLMRILGWEDPPRFLASYEWALPAIMLVVICSSASCSFGIFGNKKRTTGYMTLVNPPIIPEFSAIFIRTVHTDIIPSIVMHRLTALFADSIISVLISAAFPVMQP